MSGASSTIVIVHKLRPQALTQILRPESACQRNPDQRQCYKGGAEGNNRIAAATKFGTPPTTRHRDRLSARVSGPVRALPSPTTSQARASVVLQRGGAAGGALAGQGVAHRRGGAGGELRQSQGTSRWRRPTRTCRCKCMPIWICIRLPACVCACSFRCTCRCRCGCGCGCRCTRTWTCTWACRCVCIRIRCV